ncbi:hypothetical protein [uncultured Aquimarina sp.]|uniref:hypothetical protein n=1 Tax=uncultured Aquimarina sp. TaxID=575652 RepID=UPI00262D61ED|nr:hypothetical protein [uncultured Aquimarina sp.]
MNIRLDVVVKYVVGLTSLIIITAICLGEINPKALAGLIDYNYRKIEEKIVKALRKDYLYALNDKLEVYKYPQEKS